MAEAVGKVSSEFTIKAVVVSLLLAVLLAASNAYLALKIGTTIAASIPAAVMSIGIFRLFKRYSVFESNLVQTAASAGEGVAAAAAFVLPAMIVLHFWTHFDYWITTLVVCLGGLLGVFFSVPLRRVLLNLPELKYPEGTAIGNVLRVSANGGQGLMKFLLGGIVGGGVITFAQQGLQIAASAAPYWFQGSRVLFGMTMGFDPAAFAAGFIIGPEVCFSLLVGTIIGWVILVPALCLYFGIPHADNAYDAVYNSIWSDHLRYIGVGTMLVGGLWTLVKLVKPIAGGVAVSFRMLGNKMAIPDHERDIPMIWMCIGVMVFAACIFALLMYLMAHLQMDLTWHFVTEAAILTLLFIMVVGFLLVVICGYIVGVLGSTNSPLSGMVIISILLLGLLYLAVFHFKTHAELEQIVGFTLLVTTIVATTAVISTENMQDLKAGQMIGATPWRQQVMLAVGVVVSSLVLAPVLQLLFNAYGLAGVFPHAGMDPSQMLAAPQASLMAAVTEGIFTHQLPWNMVITGVVIAVMVILVDELICKRFKFHLSVLAFGLSIYLPPEIMLPMVVGGLLFYLVKRHLKKKQLPEATVAATLERSNLMACGMVAGSALMGVVLAIPFVISGNTNIMAPSFVSNPHYTSLVNILGLVSMLILIKMLVLKPRP